MGRLRRLGDAFDKLIKWLFFVSGGIVVFVMGAVCVDITSRGLFRLPILWVDEITAAVMIHVTFLGGAWVMKEDRHVRVEVLVERLNSRTRALLNATTFIIITILCLAITYFGVITTWDVYQRGVFTVSVLELPMAPLVGVIPIGTFLLFIQSMRMVYRYMRTVSGRTISSIDKG